MRFSKSFGVSRGSFKAYNNNDWLLERITPQKHGKESAWFKIDRMKSRNRVWLV